MEYEINKGTLAIMPNERIKVWYMKMRRDF